MNKVQRIIEEKAFPNHRSSSSSTGGISISIGSKWWSHAIKLVKKISGYIILNAWHTNHIISKRIG